MNSYEELMYNIKKNICIVCVKRSPVVEDEMIYDTLTDRELIDKKPIICCVKCVTSDGKSHCKECDYRSAYKAYPLIPDALGQPIRYRGPTDPDDFVDGIPMTLPKLARIKRERAEWDEDYNRELDENYDKVRQRYYPVANDLGEVSIDE